MRLLARVWLCFSNKNRIKYLFGFIYGWGFEIINNQWKGSYHRESSEVPFMGSRGRKKGGWSLGFSGEAPHAALWGSLEVHLAFERHPNYEDIQQEVIVSWIIVTPPTETKKWPSIYICKNYSFSLCSQNVVSWMSRRNVIPKYLILLGFQLEKKKKKTEEKEYFQWQLFEFSMPTDFSKG